MKYLVYVSSASEHFSEEDLKDLLLVSRKNNMALNITGLLLYADDSFIQVIEGDRAAIDGLYAKITSDRRHKGFLILMQGEVNERNFPDWSMGFKSISKEDFSEISGFKNMKEDNAAFDSVKQKSILYLLKNFLKINSVEARYS